MANNYFQFKQFTIFQQHCAMKVCTDACVFGAYIAEKFESKKKEANNILDIGTGTGLLSLMLAQKTTANIDGVELGAPAFKQAQTNFEESPWNDRLHIFNENILQFIPGKKYDCIVSNPPFFEGDLKSENPGKNAAKHDTTLTLDQLLDCINQHLSPGGFAAVLLPFSRMEFFNQIARTKGIYINEQLLMRHTAEHPYFRCILLSSRTKTELESSELVIKEKSGVYTEAFTNLLKDYYLYL